MEAFAGVVKRRTWTAGSEHADPAAQHLAKAKRPSEAWGSPTLIKSTNQPAAQLDLIHALIEISGNVWECKTARDVGIVQSSIPMNDSL